MFSKVYVEITNICNLHCSFCHGHSRTPGRMDRDAFCHILDQLNGFTNYIYYHLMGEPLTHPLLPEFLKMAAEKGLPFEGNFLTLDDIEEEIYNYLKKD